MNSEQEQALLASFSEITGSTDSSRFFLESANWNLELALASFYETYGMNDGTSEAPIFQRMPDQQNVSGSREEEDVESDRPSSGDPVEIVEPCEPAESVAVISSPSSTSNARFKYNLSSFKSDSSSDEEEGQAYYAGGSEHSGQQIVGPARSTHEIINDIFRSVRDRGGVEAGSHEPGGTNFFSGQGYRLGRSIDDTQVVNTNAERNRGVEENREIVLRLWRDGFNVDNGPLRSYNDPSEREFLARIRKGQIPSELFHEMERGAVHLSLQDHRHENFVPTDTRPVPFAGKGHILGRIKSNEVVESIEKNEGAGGDSNSPPVKVDETKPKTNIQIRLPDGEKILVTLNHDHTVADLRSAVIQQLPLYRAGNFTLLTFPRKELSDEKITLVEADLLGTSMLLKHQ